MRSAKIVVRMDSLTTSSSPNSSPIPHHSSRARWCSWPNMPTPREGCSAVAVGSDIYVLGGYHASLKFLSQCSKLNTDTHEWSVVPSMRQPRMGSAAVYSKERNKIYVAGGFSKGKSYLNTVEVLDLSTMEWSSLPPMTERRAGCAAVLVPKGIVVMGGWQDSENATASVELFNLSSDRWFRLSSMSMGRAGSSAVSITGYGSSIKIMVMGGYCTSSKFKGSRSAVEVFDMSSKKWTKWPSMKEKRDSAASCVVGQCVFVLGGGETSSTPSSSAEVFSLETRQWKSITPMKSKRFGSAAVTIGNRIVVLGGRSADGMHMETVESLEVPLLESIEEEPVLPLSEFLVEKHLPSCINKDMNHSSGSMLDAVSSMMEADQKRAQAVYERMKKQAKEQYERTVNETDARLQALDAERKRLIDQKAEARKQREHELAHAELEKQGAMAQIEKNFGPLLKQAQNSPSDTVGTQSFQDTSSSLSAGQSEMTESHQSSTPVDEEPPGELCCCITGCLMEDPVTAMDGHTYEKSAILKWYQQFPTNEPPTSPMTNERLPSRRLIPSHNIRSQCQTWLQRVGEDSLLAPSFQNRRLSINSTGEQNEGRRWKRVGGERRTRSSSLSRTSAHSARSTRSASMAGAIPTHSMRGSRVRTFSDTSAIPLDGHVHPAHQSRTMRTRRQSIM